MDNEHAHDNDDDDAKPLQLLSVDDDGTFNVNEDACDALRRIDTPVGVVAVCGRARQGKSYLLNALLGRSAGFTVSPRQKPCTKGIWMWSHPVPCEDAQGRPFHVVLLDTEGIDAYDQTGQYSTQIFSLAMLLSSVFVYNQMGGIDEASLDRLSLVTEMSKHIRVRAGSGAGGGAGGDESDNNGALASFTPHFLWLLRDFYFELEDDNGRSISAKEYLEDALAPMPGGGESVAAKNRIRASIKGLFPRRECMTLVRPVGDESKLRSLESLPREDLRPEFRDGLESLTDRIYRLVSPLRLDTAGTLTGMGLALLARTYADALNDGAVPTIANAWQSVAEAECRRALDAGLAAIAGYIATLTPESLVGAPDEAMDAVVSHVEATAREAFSRCAMGGPEVRASFEAQLMQGVKERCTDLKSRVNAACEMRCLETIRGMEARLRSALDAVDASADTILAAIDEMHAEYDGACAGPTKYKLWSEFCHGALRDGLPRLCVAAAEAVRVQLNEQLADARSEAATSSAQLKVAREEADLWQRRLVDQTSASEKLVEQLRGEGAGRRKEMEHIFENLRTSERRRVAAEQELMAAKSKANEEVAQASAGLAGAARREQRLAVVLAEHNENLVALRDEAIGSIESTVTQKMA